MAPSSLLLSVGSLVASSLVSATAQTYQLAESWQGESFINDWNFFHGADPTNGYVTYVNQSAAEQSGLVKVTSSGSFYMGVDYENTLNPNGPGRESVRIETKKYYTQGLYVIDLEHMPGSICGTWPAFWSVGKDWPNDGEIDIIEGVNLQKANEIVLHTSGTCDVSGSNEMTGTLSSSECGESSGTIGCVVKGTNGSSGDPFNEAGGGVYAMEWTDAFIKIWFFARSQIPASLSSGNPDTSSFGTPMAHLQGSCDFSERFKAQKFIFDTTFCGDWAGGVFGESSCPMSDSSSPLKSCVNYVAENPAAFKEAYWEINSIKVYQYGVSAASSAAVSQATTSKVEGTMVSVQAANTATSTVAVPAETTAVPQPAQTNTVAEGTAADHSTLSSATTTTTTAPNVPAATAAPTASGAEGDDSELESTSIVYVTSTTTICPVAESSSAAVLDGKKNSASNANSGAEVVATSIVATPAAAASEHPAADAVANSAAATSTVTKSEGVASRLTAGALSEIPTTPPNPVSQAVSTGSFHDSDTAQSDSEEQSPIASASAAPSTIPVPVSSGAAALGGSSSASSFTSSRRVPSPTGSSTAASVTAIATWSPAAGERASGTATGSATLTAPSEVVFTPGLSNGANRMSVGISGLIGVMFIAVLA